MKISENRFNEYQWVRHATLTVCVYPQLQVSNGVKTKQKIAVYYGQQTSSRYLTRTKAFLFPKLFFFALHEVRLFTSVLSLKLYLPFFSQHVRFFFFQVIFNHCLIPMGPSKMSKTLMKFVTKSCLKTVKQCYALVIVFMSSVSRLGKPQRFEGG